MSKFRQENAQAEDIKLMDDGGIGSTELLARRERFEEMTKTTYFDLIRELFPNANDAECEFILFERTAFPLAGLEEVKKQLREYKIEKLEKERKDLTAQLEFYKVNNKVMKEALEFYADESNYDRKVVSESGNWYTEEPIADDRGKRANDAFNLRI